MAEEANDVALNELRAKAARKQLLANQPTLLRKACTVIDTVLTNIISNPTEEKYRRLPISKPALQKKIVSVPGAFEYLQSVCGFEVQGDDERTSVLQLDEVDNDHLELLKQCLTFVQSVRQHAEAKDTLLPDCVVKVMLPDGTTPSLGFARTEKLQVLHELVQAVFFPRTPFSLCTRAPRRELQDADMESTFQELGFTRAVLVVDPAVRKGEEFKNKTPATLSAAMIRTKLIHASMPTELERRAAAHEAGKRAKAKAKEDRAHRAQVLKDFEEDRANVQVKAEQQKQRRLAEAARAKEQAQLLEEQRKKDALARGYAVPNNNAQLGNVSEISSR